MPNVFCIDEESSFSLREMKNGKLHKEHSEKTVQRKEVQLMKETPIQKNNTELIITEKIRNRHRSIKPDEEEFLEDK